MDQETEADPLSTRIYRHLRSNVYGLVAIFIALGGTGYAATQLTENSVRSRHIEDRQVKGPDLTAGAVASGKVKRHSLNGSDLGNNTIRDRQLADSALFARTKIVDPEGDPAENGRDLLAAVASINDSGPATPYLVQLGPGDYDLGGDTLALPANVELAGAGPGVTTVTSTGAGANPVDTGPANEIRDLAIQASGASTRALTATSTLTIYDATLSAQGDGVTGVFVGGDASIQIRGSAIMARSTTAQQAVAVDAAGSGVTTLDDGRIAATTDSSSGVATAVLSRISGTVKVRGSTVEAGGPGGSNASALATSRSGSITADASSVSGSTTSLENGGDTSSTIRVGGSRLSGPVATPGFGSVSCALSYSASYVPLTSACN